MTEELAFPIGSLVSVRGRSWVVQPGSTEELLFVRPLDGNGEEQTGILMSLEGDTVRSTVFPDPTVERIGDAVSCRMLRDAMRVGIRDCAGPFRCFGRIAVEPRPYQYVPMMMGLRLHPVRMLIADDVGIGKTIESCLLARELLDRGEIRRICVLCPPPLAEQWQEELRTKFHIEARLVLPGTIRQLEHECGQANSVFDVCPFTVVSIDFIKSDRRREDFLRAAPEFVIVDEAHGATAATGAASRQQRYSLVKRLCEDPDRHVVFVTATPHSGNADAFRNLLGFLNPEFPDYPEDLSG
ncbi:MAG: DEAD/DEAH box helicase, partial [Planctomycetia bacterium]|nr:DEAD/DEAH box helicase [Planctomycetia bacterium]